MIKLHLGCGKRYLEGYLHVDQSKYKHIDYVKPIYPLPFIENECVEEIYCSHALEYFDFNQAILVLKEWKRCLADKGKLRLSVPDFDQLLKVYNSKSYDIDAIIGPLFGRWKGDKGEFIYHKTVYTRKKIEEILILSGFKSIETWDPLDFFGINKESFDDYSKAYYPHLDFINGIPLSLNILAAK
ncbi:class I SAM-dependent methyltransferase [Prochlorococcus marinus]|uniref:class I SAM-dependent methyltransferase n=1 Tax=Prochlorococcus marinus TaxID=1219 RepID=UPI0022B33228|nr:hypothetical protein [Prochlorococcus marinus]